MTVEQAISEPKDQFPIGMRVLAVDDDPTCLLLLETLLRRCQYHVTTTSQAITALKLLRENKNKFDLVISDVHMPDMDGFKLLELVGLEMDLPVIMLSANGDTKLVMKGITHGACDYLLKPVRIEELKNIWQHVVRRKKFDRKDQNDFDSQHKPHNGSSEAAGMGNADQNGKLNKKRKDQNEEEEEERDETGNDNEDPSTQKKPRVVWSVDLHRKFVAAVHQLGIDKAVPKKILELMNVDKLTRENVASHLQKYRLYLKRISCVANQQANMAAALGTTDSPYLRIGSLNGLGNFHALAGPDQFHNTAFRSFPPSGMLGRLNTPVGLGMRGLPSSGMIQLGQAQNSGNANNDQSKFQSVIIPGNCNSSILQGMPMSLELDKLPHNQGVTHIRELPTAVDNKTVFPVSSSFLDAKVTGCSNNPLLDVTNKCPVLEESPQEAKDGKIFGNQSSVTLSSLNSGSSSHLPDLSRCIENWPSAVQSSGVQPNTFSLSDCFQQATSHPSNLRNTVSTAAFQNGSILPDFSSVSSPNQFAEADLAVTVSSDAGQIINSGPQDWDVPREGVLYHSNIICNSVNSSISTDGPIASVGQSLDPSNTIFHRKRNLGAIGQTNFGGPLPIRRNEVENLVMDTSVNLREGYLIGQQKPQASYISNTVGSLEDLASAMVKQEQDSLKPPEGDFDFNAYSSRHLYQTRF